MSQEPSTSADTAKRAPNDYMVPLDVVARRLRDITYDLDVEENAMVALSTAVEHFLRYLIRESSSNGENEMTYDSISNVIDHTKFDTLKEFFPPRIPYRLIAGKVAEADSRDEMANIE